MPLEIDSAAVIAAMNAHRILFVDFRAALKKTAHDVVVKTLKLTDLPRCREIRSTLGGEGFDLICDAMTDAEVKSILKRLDGRHPALKGGSVDELRRRLHALAAGQAEPETATAPAKRAPRPSRTKTAAAKTPESPAAAQFMSSPKKKKVADPPPAVQSESSPRKKKKVAEPPADPLNYQSAGASWRR